MNRKRSRFRLLTWFRAGCLAVAALAAGSLYTPYPARLAQALRGGQKVKTVIRRVEVPKPVEAPAPAPAQEVRVVQAWHPENAFSMPAIELPPFPVTPPARVEPGTYKLDNYIVNGPNISSIVHFKPGTTASADRKDKEGYLLKVEIQLFSPHAAEGKALLQDNPDLPHALAAYDALMRAAKVSPWFEMLYARKQNAVRSASARLDNLLDRHNYYDTDTLLQITAPGSGRRVLWLQADMDVDTDGSDGDRLPTMSDKVVKNPSYQPTTSYRWKKRTSTPNPFLAGREERLRNLRRDRPKDTASLKRAEAGVQELKNNSFLIAEYDPFIVAPGICKDGKDATYRPEAGDYAVVIVGKDIYPAIVGDFGPREKTGEASQRINKMVNAQSTQLSRAVSDLKVSYLIFPGTKEPESGPIDYPRLNMRCRELLQELGGMGEGAVFHDMDDLLAPPPAPEQPKK